MQRAHHAPLRAQDVEEDRDGGGVAAVGVVDQVEVLADQPARLARERHVVALRDRERAKEQQRIAAQLERVRDLELAVDDAQPVLDVAHAAPARLARTRARHCSITSDEELSTLRAWR